MSKQITVVLSAGRQQEFHSPLLSDEQFEDDYARIVAAQEQGGHELLTLTWLSVRQGTILAVHLTEEDEDRGPVRVARWE